VNICYIQVNVAQRDKLNCNLLLNHLQNFQTNDIMEPNGGLAENCVAMIAADDFFLHDENCDAALAVMCEAPLYTDTQFYM
jgi:hypothetical protein